MFKKILNFEDTDPKQNQRSKNLLTYGLLTIFILIIIIIASSYQTNKNNKIKIKNKSNSANKIDIVSSLNVKAEDEWISKSETDLKTLQEQNQALLKRLELLEQSEKENQEKFGNTVDALATELANTKMQIESSQAVNQNDQKYNEYGELINKNKRNDIASIVIDLETDTAVIENNYNDLNSYIPAGSYVTAKMLSGADVSTGTQMQSDPNNMMFEIISPAVAPKFNGKIQEIKKVNGCRLMAQATGQLWTERAYIRLIKLSCSFEKGRVAEFPVKGYVTSFAKEGVRGKVVSREGYFTSMAFLAGAVDGLANITEKPTLEVNSGIATENINGKDITKQAGASGLGKAAEMLSDYYIKRAEQYQSVIDVPTGIEVEIVFQDGVDLTKDINFKLKTKDVGMPQTQQYVSNNKANVSENNIAHSNNWNF